MKTFSVITKSGTVYNYVSSWQKWEFDESFIQFSWDGGKILILPFEDIKAIEQKN